jgi:hypothetical protein
LLLVFSLLTTSCATIKPTRTKRKGAELIVQKKDGQQVRGELITVKNSSLLLLDSEGADVSIDIADIKVIRIVKKSKAILGASSGLLIGGGGAALLGQAASDTESPNVWILGALIFGGLGLLIGAGTGALLGIDKIIQIEGKSDSEIKEILEKLSKKARIQSLQ